MSATPKQYEQDIQRVFDLLIRGPFSGTIQDIANATGTDYDRVNGVLGTVRTPEWIEDHHWTIPYVRRGTAANTWIIADTLDNSDNATMRWSQQRRADELLGTTRRNIAQCELALNSLDGRSSAARHWNEVLVMLRAMEVHVGAMIKDFEATNGVAP